MEVFELIDAVHGPRLVRFALEGREIVREYGRVGESLRRREHTFEDEPSARKALQGWLLKLQVAGYTLGEHNPALIEELAAAPDELAPYLVYADWLIERGDPRGELISVMVAREQQPEELELRAREQQLRAAHPMRFVRPSWAELDALVWRWGFVEGFCTRHGIPTNLAVGESWEPTRNWGMQWIEQHLTSLWNHPSGRFVRRVVRGEQSFAARRQANGHWLLTREAKAPQRFVDALQAAYRARVSS